MAYLLRFDDATSSASGDYVTLPALIQALSSQNFRLLIDGTPAANVDHYRPVGGSTLGIDSPRVICFANGTVRLTSSSGTNREWTAGVPLNQINTLEFVRVAGALNLYVNGNLRSGGFTGDAQQYGLGVIGGNFGTTSRAFDLRLIEFEIDGVVTNRYDPSASNGTGTTLIDTVGGNNGTLVNFPTDNSQWVFYESGSAANESTVSYDLGAIDYAVSSQITAPANTTSVSYDLGAIDYAVSAQQLAPGNNASLSYDIGAISYAVSAQQSVPQFSASVGYEIGAIGFVVQANTGAAIRTITALYDIGSIEWQVSSEWLPDDATAVIGYDIGEIAFNSSVLNIPEGGFPSEPSKQYPNNPGWRYSVFFR